MKVRGFTLIELLVITGIIIFLSAITIPLYRVGESRSALQRASHKLAQDIRRAQEMAVSAYEFPPGQPVPGGYGVRFEMGLNYYILFADKAENGLYDGSVEQVEVCALEKGVIISRLSSSPLNIVFVPPDPEVLINVTEKTASIGLSSQGKNQEIIVNKAGRIEIK